MEMSIPKLPQQERYDNATKRTSAYHAYLDDGKLTYITYIAKI